MVLGESRSVVVTYLLRPPSPASRENEVEDKGSELGEGFPGSVLAHASGSTLPKIRKEILSSDTASSQRGEQFKVDDL